MKACLVAGGGCVAAMRGCDLWICGCGGCVAAMCGYMAVVIAWLQARLLCAGEDAMQGGKVGEVRRAQWQGLQACCASGGSHPAAVSKRKRSCAERMKNGRHSRKRGRENQGVHRIWRLPK
eukprot:scaffold137_cov22-Tisochrysis_lutea.AAC.1